MTQPYPIAYVQWIDAESFGRDQTEWHDREETLRWADKEIEPMDAVGWLVADNDDFITLVLVIGPEEISGTIKIPKSQIIKKTIIKK